MKRKRQPDGVDGHRVKRRKIDPALTNINVDSTTTSPPRSIPSSLSSTGPHDPSQCSPLVSTAERLLHHHPLTSEQSAIANAPFSPGFLVVSANPGTGKTHTMIGRILSGIAGGVVQKPEDVLVLMFTKSARSEARDRLRSSPELSGFIKRVQTFHGFALSHIQKDRRWEPFGKLDPTKFWNTILHDPALLRRVPLQQEKASVFHHLEKIRQDAMATGSEIDDPLYHRFHEYCERCSRIDFTEMLFLALKSLRERPLSHPPCAIIVDESQDLTEALFQLLIALKSPHVSCLGDRNQRIYRFSGVGSIDFVPRIHDFARVSGDSVTEALLSHDMRCGTAIQRLYRFLQEPSRYEGEIKEPRPMPWRSLVGVSHSSGWSEVNGEPTVPEQRERLHDTDESWVFVVECTNLLVEAEAVVAFVEKQLLQQKSVGVLFRSERSKKVILPALQSSFPAIEIGIEEIALDDDDSKSQSSAPAPGIPVLDEVQISAPAPATPDLDDKKGSFVAVMSIHQSKGKEFDSVAIVDVVRQNFPFTKQLKGPSNVEEFAMERRILFVGVSRCKRHLALFYPLDLTSSKDYFLNRDRLSDFVNDAPREFFAWCAASDMTDGNLRSL